MSALFKDQFSKTSEWFSSWNECEQVVAVYNLMKMMSPSQACFLSKVLPQLPSSNTSLDIELLEYQANDPNFIANLRKELPEILIKELVKLLPLLKPSSFLAAREYVKLTSFILSNPSFKTFMVYDLYQIIFYLSLHPSVSKEDWHQLYIWRNNLEEMSTFRKIDPLNDHFSTSDSFLPLVQVSDASLSHHVPDTKEVGTEMDFLNVPNCFIGSNYLLPPLPQDAYSSRKISNSFSLADDGVLYNNQIEHKNDKQLHAVKSLLSTPAPKQHQTLTRTSSISCHPNFSDWITHNALRGTPHINQTYLKADHAPLSPQSSGASTGSVGSDLHNLPDDIDPAMKDISMWLKSLRLHKYLLIFEKLNYDEMMELKEEWLAGQGVTKGARNKILINIKKLHERPGLLKTIEKNILDGNDLGQSISDLKPIIFAPISSCSKIDGTSNEGEISDHMTTTTSENYSTPDGTNSFEENLPTLISRVLGKVFSQLLISMYPDTECINNYLQLLERCSNHYSFTGEQKRKITFWRQQIQNTWNSLSNKHANKCKTSHPQNLSLPFNKSKSKLGQRYSNPINSSQSCLSMKPPLMAHHHHQKMNNPPSPPPPPPPPPHHFHSPPCAVFPSATLCHQPYHGIPLQHSELPPAFGHQSLLAPLQIQIDPQDSRHHFHDAREQYKIPLGRTQSAPLSSPVLNRSFVPRDGLENEVASSPTTEDIHANLESLCINMMQHALGNSSD